VVDDHLVERLGPGAAVQHQEPGRAAPDQDGQQGAAAALVREAERELVALRPQGLDLGPDGPRGQHGGGPAGRGHDLAADVEQQGLVPVMRAYASSRASSPAPSTSSRDSVCWTVPARWSSTYCSLTRRENRASVMAMNGTSNGTSNTGKPARSAASRTRPAGWP
jgi:hypothetical protein